VPVRNLIGHDVQLAAVNVHLSVNPDLLVGAELIQHAIREKGVVNGGPVYVLQKDFRSIWISPVKGQSVIPAQELLVSRCAPDISIQAELATGRQVEIRVRGVYILLCLRGGPILSLRVIPCGLLCLCGLASGGVLFGSADGEKYSSGYGEHKECRAGRYQQGGFFLSPGLTLVRVLRKIEGGVQGHVIQPFAALGAEGGVVRSLLTTVRAFHGSIRPFIGFDQRYFDYTF